jgi:hypothetical protein
MGTTAIDQVPARPRESTSPVRTPPVPPMVRRAHMCLSLRVAAVIAILCASLTTACSSGAVNSAVPARTELSSSGGPTEPGSPVTRRSTATESTAPASQTPSTATGPTAPASPTSSTLPTYNPGTVSPTSKPTETGSGVISLGNIGSPTVDSRHPNGSAGHNIPFDTAPDSPPHCILMTLPPLPLTGPPFSGPGCVLRLDIPAPASNVERTGHFTFILQTQCVDRAVAPCSLLAGQPTAVHPVTVRWSPGPFYVVFCGSAPLETEADAAAGKCVYESPSASASPSSS